MNEQWNINLDRLRRFPLYSAGAEYEGIATAVGMAEEIINNERSPILKTYTLVVKNVSSECNPDLVLRNFVNYYSHRKHLVGVLGPCKYLRHDLLESTLD